MSNCAAHNNPIIKLCVSPNCLSAEAGCCQQCIQNIHNHKYQKFVKIEKFSQEFNRLIWLRDGNRQLAKQKQLMITKLTQLLTEMKNNFSQLLSSCILSLEYSIINSPFFNKNRKDYQMMNLITNLRQQIYQNLHPKSMSTLYSVMEQLDKIDYIEEQVYYYDYTLESIRKSFIEMANLYNQMEKCHFIRQYSIGIMPLNPKESMNFVYMCQQLARITKPNNMQLPNKNALASYKYGMEETEKRNYEQAIRHFNLSIVQCPRYAQAYFYKALTLQYDEKYIQALKYYNVSIHLNDKYINSFINKGNVLKELGRVQESLENFDLALKLDSKNSYAYVYKSICLIAIKKYKEAYECIERALKLNPSNSKAYLHKGRIYYNLRKFQEAMKYFNFAEQLSQHDDQIQYYKGSLFIEYNEFEYAKKHIDKALDRNPNNLLYLKAKVKYLKGMDLDKEAKELEENIKMKQETKKSLEGEIQHKSQKQKTQSKQMEDIQKSSNIQ